VGALTALAGVGWLFAGLVACSQPGNETVMQQKTIQTVLKENTDKLMALPGVVGTALGECSGKPCIKVFVVKKTPELLKQIPATLDGYTVAVQETGDFRARDPG
jgi:hypothetical protein